MLYDYNGIKGSFDIQIKKVQSNIPILPCYGKEVNNIIDIDKSHYLMYKWNHK